MKDYSGDNSAYHDHMAEIGTDAMEREKAFFFATRESRTVNLIEQALMRIKQGTYGICQECKKPISRSRLQSIPYANLCVVCKEDEK